MAPSPSHIGIGREVNDGVGAGEFGSEPLGLGQQIEGDDATGKTVFVQELLTAGREVVDDSDFDAVALELVRQIRSDETCATGDGNFHFSADP